ncbi:MAG TPA: formyltetrahydrofolate deformylase [Thermoleophilaceae bacterium]|nr:formyltetrahydrofolate deformylase [Thermoleophilaceae bacterium]
MTSLDRSVEVATHGSHRLLLTCPDRTGIIAAVTGFLAARGANILEADQHSDPDAGLFAMRLEFEGGAIDAVKRDFASEVARPLDMSWKLTPADSRPRIAILCSREDHCLFDLLLRIRAGELSAEVVAVLSTTDEHAEQVAGLGFPYRHVPVEPDGMTAHEHRLLDSIGGTVDLAVLARYMRILSGGFLRALGAPAINIHHSFLPAFPGAEPYRRAHERGVKLIGATAHYVTEELDAGPIIEQDVVRVSHRHRVEDLGRVGRDVERVVLARAVLAHLEDRVARWSERTVVF